MILTIKIYKTDSMNELKIHIKSFDGILILNKFNKARYNSVPLVVNIKDKTPKYFGVLSIYDNENFYYTFNNYINNIQFI